MSTKKTPLPKRSAAQLTKLANFLADDITNAEFNLEIFATIDPAKPKGCGTVGCACGWAAASPKFSGLSLKKAGSTGTFYDIVHDKTGSTLFKAAREYFNLSAAQVEYLFEPTWYSYARRTRKWVINRIRKFVDDGGLIKDKFLEHTNDLDGVVERYEDD